MKFAHVCVLQQTLHGNGNERQDFVAETDDHAMEELADACVHELPLCRGIERVQEDAQGLSVCLDAATLLHGLLAREALARSTETQRGSGSMKMFSHKAPQQFNNNT